MSFTVIIPARYGSTRMPAKPLADLHGEPLIAHVVKRASAAAAKRVIVATDDQRIAAALSEYDCEVCMTAVAHQSGSDRLAEVVAVMNIDDAEIIVNVQGDEPTIPPRLIDEVASKLAAAPQAVMSTAAQQISSNADYENPNIVKVVIDQHGRALYFSRAGIPFYRGEQQLPASPAPDVTLAWHHIGIYAYRAAFLKRYTSLQPSALEQAESLEQLRVLDNGETIMVHTIDYDAGIGVDTPADLERAKAYIQQAQAW